MAAIVSQLAAANRRRKANKKNHVPIDKSVYVLPPFDPCFKPEVHNRYIRHKQAKPFKRTCESYDTLIKDISQCVDEESNKSVEISNEIFAG